MVKTEGRRSARDYSLSLNVPNTITVLRLLLTGTVISLLLIGNNSNIRFAAGILFILAWLSDGLDGYFARKLGQSSLGGALLDLIADRLLTTPILIISIILGYWQRVSDLTPLGYWPYMVVVEGADMALIFGIISFMLKRSSRNLEFPTPTLVVRISFPVQMATLLVAITGIGPSWLQAALMYFSIIFTILAVISYLKKGGYVITA
jgi:phosphatidylglycerophosphate synthase